MGGAEVGNTHRKVPGSESSENGYLGACWCQGRGDAWPCPAAPDATAGDGLAAFGTRDELIRQLVGIGANVPDILGLPALRDVLAAAARDAEKVRRVQAAIDEFYWLAENGHTVIDTAHIRRALDGTS